MPAQKEIVDFLEEIDLNYFRAKRNRVSRMDVTWGKWSRNLNLRMRERQNQTEDPIKSLLIWLFMYWMNRSELLELHFKHPVTAIKKKKEARESGRNMRNIIISGDPIGLPEGEDPIRKLLKSVEKEFNKKDDSAN